MLSTGWRSNLNPRFFMLTVSVIIPSFNRSSLLGHCLDSVASQTTLPLEIIVVDDGSSDETIEMLSSRPGVKLITQENSGPGAARNRGAAVARGEYLAFLDSDDLWFPWTLEDTLKMLREYKPSLLYSKFVDFYGSVNVSREQLSASYYSSYLDTAGQRHFAGAGMMFVDRLRFLEVGGFADDRLNAEDHDFGLRMGTAPGFVQIKSPCTLAHRVHDGNEMNNQQANLAGLDRLVSLECAGQYPGGKKYQAQRRQIISDHLRPAVLRLAGSPLYRQVFTIWRRTVFWSFSFKRIPYLIFSSLVLLRSFLFLHRGQATRGPSKNDD